MYTAILLTYIVQGYHFLRGLVLITPSNLTVRHTRGQTVHRVVSERSLLLLSLIVLLY